MTEEKKDAEISEEKVCRCECCEAIKKFLIITCGVFVGTLLAILVASALLRPNMPACPCHKGMMGPHFGMEKQFPPNAGFEHKKMFHDNGKKPDFHKNHPNFGKDGFDRQKPER